jgi:tetratricopeptide (TPR) repeat protein
MKRTKSGGLHRTAALALSRALLMGGLVGAGIVAAPAAAQAQASSDVFYVDLAPLGRDASDSVARRINEGLKQNLQTVRVKFTSDLLSAKAGSSGNAGLDEATSDYNKGIGLIAVGDFNGAAELLTTALDKFKKNASELGDATPVVDATFKLAEAQFKANDQEMARSTLFKALALNPAGEALESSGQAYKQFFDSVRSGMSRNGKGSLTVQTTPAGLAVSVDGQPRGNGPVTLEDLPVGDHWVTVAGEGGQVSGQVIAVQRGRTATAKIDIGRSGGGGASGAEPRYLRSLRSEVAGGAIGDGLLPYMKELTARQGAKFVVVGVVVKRADGFEALTFVYRAEDGLFANGPKQKFNKELSNVSSGAYSLAAGVATALQRFPATDLVKGTPILPPEAIAPVVAAPAAAPMQPAAAPMMAIPTYEPPAPVAVVAPPAPPAPAPAPKPVPAAPAYTPPPAAPAYTPPPAAPAYTAPKPAPAPAYGQAPAYGTPAPAYGQAPAYGAPAPAYGQAPAYGAPAPNAGYPSANYTPPGQLPMAEPAPEPAVPDIYGDLMEEPSESFMNKPVVWYSAAGVVAATVLTVVLMQPEDAPATTARPILSW